MMSSETALPQAKWRGEIKIQQERGVPGKLATFLVKSEDDSIVQVFPPDKKLRVLMNGRPRAYFKATLLGDGTIDIRQEVPDRGW